MKKYKITSAKHPDIPHLFRIKALRNFGAVKKGELGGFIEKEINLSHDGNCWVYGNACVDGNARVSENARVYGSAHVYGNACVSENAWVSENAHVYGSAHVYENACVDGNAHVYGNARVSENVCVSENAHVYGSAHVYENAWVYGNAHVYGNARVSENARVYDCEITKFTQILNITNLKYNLTIMPNNVVGGCRTFTHDEFKKLTLAKCQDKTWTKEQLNHYKSFLKIWEEMQKVY